MVADAILKAAEKCGLPDGVFSSLQGAGNDLGEALVLHPKTKAVAFTGSLKGGMALYKMAAQRDEPIPVFAEMGSINPVFVLPEIIEQQGAELANQIATSVNLGSGQFCTNPGLIILKKDKTTDRFLDNLKEAFAQLVPTTMLHQGICENYLQVLGKAISQKGVVALYQAENIDGWKGSPALLSTSATHFLANESLQDEVFWACNLVGPL